MMKGVAFILASAALAASLGALSVTPADGNGGRDRCARKGSVTLITKARVRVYRQSRDSDSAAFACHRPTGRATRLGFSRGGLFQYAGARATAIRGSIIAYGLVTDPDAEEGGPGYQIVVGRLPIRGPAYNRGTTIPAVKTEPFDAQADNNLAIERLLIAPNRTILYASCANIEVFDGDHCRRPLSSTRIVAIPFDDEAREYQDPVVLDQGDGINPRTLRLSPSGTRAAWTADGQTRKIRVP